jgi:hypothetical protein
LLVDPEDEPDDADTFDPDPDEPDPDDAPEDDDDAASLFFSPEPSDDPFDGDPFDGDPFDDEPLGDFAFSRLSVR